MGLQSVSDLHTGNDSGTDAAPSVPERAAKVPNSSRKGRKPESMTLAFTGPVFDSGTVAISPITEPIQLSCWEAIEIARVVDELTGVRLKACENCGMRGTVECSDCRGEGQRRCTCDDCGDRHRAQCDDCAGTGRVRCKACTTVPEIPLHTQARAHLDEIARKLALPAISGRVPFSLTADQRIVFVDMICPALPPTYRPFIDRVTQRKIAA